MRACEGRAAPRRADISLRMRELYGPGCECSSEYPGGRAQDPDDRVKQKSICIGNEKEKTARFRAVKNRGTRGDSLLMLSPSGLSNRKPLLLSDSESGGSMSQAASVTGSIQEETRRICRGASSKEYSHCRIRRFYIQVTPIRQQSARKREDTASGNNR